MRSPENEGVHFSISKSASLASFTDKINNWRFVAKKDGPMNYYCFRDMIVAYLDNNLNEVFITGKIMH